MRSWVLGVGALAACHGDVTGAGGDLGRLRYELATDYEAEQEDLRSLPLITRYEAWISVEATARGDEDADGELGSIEHRSDDARVKMGGGEPPSFSILADTPGPVTVESTLDDRVFDKITLTFADPDALALVVWARAPWADDWDDVTDEQPLQAEVGTQIVFLAVPIAGGTRLGGEFTPEITVDQPDLVIPDEQVLFVQEGGITAGGEPVVFYGVGEGTATFVVTDPEHALSETRTVTFVP